ncbi:Hypothetical protein FKW44_017424 [Caligus rogercresseyi]|uniref:Uncharacterized protein n=1 Tax=Caligus rogercresseyi TaxID=217165 RepID=A0A7T8JWN8_CALRO|nr:Hypothetical protein FKW44_017424 [Caligus rogercresseyi]
MSLCCEIGCRSVFLSEFTSRGNPPPFLYASPVVKNSPQKAHKDPVTAEFVNVLVIHSKGLKGSRFIIALPSHSTCMGLITLTLCFNQQEDITIPFPLTHALSSEPHVLK